MNELMMFAGQAIYAGMRMLSMRGVAAGRPWLAVCMDAGQLLVMLLVLSGGVAAVQSGDWFSVGCVVAGQIFGGLVAMRMPAKQEGAAP